MFQYGITDSALNESKDQFWHLQTEKEKLKASQQQNDFNDKINNLNRLMLMVESGDIPPEQAQTLLKQQETKVTSFFANIFCFTFELFKF